MNFRIKSGMTAAMIDLHLNDEAEASRHWLVSLLGVMPGLDPGIFFSCAWEVRWAGQARE